MPAGGKKEDHLVVGDHDITKEAKGVLRHVFEGGQTMSRDQWLSEMGDSYDKYMSEFAKADTNHDGALDRSEWKADGQREEDFEVWDLTGDGKVDADEYAFMKKTEKELTKLDADGDGKITREEWIAKYGSDKGFSEYDLDGDGLIDADEFRKGKAGDVVFDHMLEKIDTDGDGKISREEWTARYGNADGFDQYDLDGDGVIDANEFRSVHAAQIDFSRLDLDGDGVISREEWYAKYGTYDGFDQFDADGDGKIDAKEFITKTIADQRGPKPAAEQPDVCAPNPPPTWSRQEEQQDPVALVSEFKKQKPTTACLFCEEHPGRLCGRFQCLRAKPGELPRCLGGSSTLTTSGPEWWP